MPQPMPHCYTCSRTQCALCHVSCLHTFCYALCERHRSCVAALASSRLTAGLQTAIAKPVTCPHFPPELLRLVVSDLRSPLINHLATEVHVSYQCVCVSPGAGLACTSIHPRGVPMPGRSNVFWPRLWWSPPHPVRACLYANGTHEPCSVLPCSAEMCTRDWRCVYL